MKKILFLTLLSILLTSCSLDLEKEHTREVGIVKISQIQKIQGVKVIEMELFNIMGVNNELLERQIAGYKFYVANIKLIPKDLLGNEWKKKQGYFGGKDVKISYKILRPNNPLILTLTKFEEETTLSKN